MPALDVRTISTIFAINSLVATLVMVALWRQSRKQVSGTHLWLICFALQTAMFLLFALRNVIPDVFSILVANTGIAVAAFILYLGLERFTACQSPQRHNYIILGVFVCLFTYFTFFQPDVAIRIVLISTTVMLMFLQGSWLMLHRVEPELRPLTRAAGIMCVLYVLNQCYRIVLAFLMPSPGDLLSANVFDTFGQALNATLFVGWVFVLVLMVNRRIIIDFQKSEEKLVSSKVEAEISRREITEVKQAEEALAESEDRYKSLVGNVPDIIFTIDLAGKLTFVSRRIEEILGYESAEAINMNILNFIPEEDRQRAMESLQIGMAGEKVIHFQTPMIKKSGERLFCECSFTRVYKNGALIGAQGTASDITYRKQAEQMLKLSSQRMKSLLQLNQMTEATLQEITDFALEEAVRLTRSKIGYLAFLNEDESVLTMHSWSKSAMAECAINDKPFIYPVLSTGLWGEAVRQRQPIITNDYTAANPLIKGIPQGHVVLKRHMNTPVFDGSRIVIVAGVGNKTEEYNQDDVQQLTLLMEGLWQLLERKRTSAVLLENRAILQLTLDEASIGIAMVGMDKRFLNCNKAFCTFLGYSEDELKQKTIADITLPEDADIGIADMRAIAMGEMKTSNVQKRYVQKDGKVVWGEVRINLVRNSQGKPIYFLPIIQDITERKQMENELRRHREHLEVIVVERTDELKAVNQELEAFSYSVSHDLRAPLRSIDGFSQALLQDYPNKLDEQGKHYLQRVRSNTQKMGEIIDDLLKLSRLTRSEMKLETVNLSALAQSIATELQKTEPERQVEFVIMPGMNANGDENLLRLLLENLLGNAWKYTGKHPQARIEFGSTQTDGKQAFFVRDDGAGFDMTYADKLFAPFQRLHSADEFPGIGIGLATVQRIIHRHGGRVWAEGEIEKGATFYFTLAQT